MKPKWKMPSAYAVQAAATVPAIEFNTNVETDDRRLMWFPETGELVWRTPGDVGDDAIAIVHLRELKKRLRAQLTTGQGQAPGKYTERARNLIANYFCLFAEYVDPLKRRLRTNDWELINARINDVFERINNGTTDR